MANPWRLTHLPLTPDYFITRPLILISAKSFPYSAGSDSLFHCFFFFFDYPTAILPKQTTRSEKYTRQLKEAQKRGKQNFFNLREDCFYGKPFWKTGVAQRSRPLQREYPREAGAAKADAKHESCTKDRLWGLAGGLETSNLCGNFTGLREIFLFCLLQ